MEIITKKIIEEDYSSDKMYGSCFEKKLLHYGT